MKRKCKLIKFIDIQCTQDGGGRGRKRGKGLIMVEEKTK